MPSGVPYAPGNDPFVITVGAVDLEGSVYAWRHDVPNWSAYGYTKDGFRKPELAAAGRYMIGPVPAAGTLRAAKPENVVSSGYMRLSGTSFSAPVVAGAAALLHMEHPTWTPDQIKGALMQRARYIRDAPSGSAGVGEINAYRSTLLSNPPNPNAALNKFRKLDPLTGMTEFDGSAWYAAAKASVSWDSVSWSDVSWSDVSWTRRLLVGRVLERRVLVGRVLERRSRSGRRELGGQRRDRGREPGRRLRHDSGRRGTGSRARAGRGASGRSAGSVST